MPPTKTWKSVEAKVAGFFGSRRTPLSGGNSAHTRSDSLNPYVFVETKYRRNHYAVELYRKSLPLARAEGKILTLALVQHRTQEPTWLLCIDPRDLFRLARLVQKSRKSCRKLRRPKALR